MSEKLINFVPNDNWYAVFHTDCHSIIKQCIHEIRLMGWGITKDGKVKGLISTDNCIQYADEAINFIAYIHKDDLSAIKDKYENGN